MAARRALGGAVCSTNVLPPPPPPPIFAQSPPDTPSSVSVTRSNASLTASWASPASATHYHVTYSADGGASWHAPVNDHRNVPTNSITFGVDNAKTYTIGVRARNDNGWSGWRNSAPSGPYTPPTPTPTPTPTPEPTPTPTPEPTPTPTPVTAPDRPTGLTATAGNGSVTLAWDDPANTTITGYEYQVNHNNTSTGNLSGWGEWTAVAGNVMTVTIDGLTNGKEYRFKLRAVNATGAGKPSGPPWYVAATPTLLPPPATPTGLSVTPGDGYLDITWDAVSEATSYDVRAKAQGAADWHDVAGNVTATSYTYATSETMDYVAVRARSANGASAWTEASRLPPDDLLPIATGLSSGGASAQSVQAQSQLAAPTWGNIKRYIVRQPNAALDVNWTGASGATAYNIVCSGWGGGWDWYKCGWDDDGTVKYTSVPSNESQPVTVSHYRRTGSVNVSPGDVTLDSTRSYVLFIRAVNADPSQASAWVSTPPIRPLEPVDYETIAYTRTDSQITLSWTPYYWTTGYEIDCDTYTPNVPYDPDYTVCATLSNVDRTDASHGVTISTWTDDGTDYAIDNTSIYDIQITSTNEWGRRGIYVPLIHPNPTLGVSAVTSSGATLTIANHNGNWYYKANAAPDNTCQGPVSGTTKTLSGLTEGTSYTYEAFSDSACTDTNKLATASAFTPVSLAVSNIGATTATLTISGHSGQWWYKGNAGPDSTCQGPISAGDSTEDLTGLSPQSSYDYTAYNATGCADGDLLATAPRFTTVATVSNLANAKGSADKEVTSTKDRAIQFTTGPHAEGFDLQSVTLTLKQKTAGGTLRVALHADSSGVPASTALATLTGTAPTSSSWTDATFTCSAAACDNLGSATTYYIVLENTANSGAWSWAWSASGNETKTPNTNGWNIGDGYVNRGTFWSAETSTHYLAQIGFYFRPSLQTGSITATGAALTLDYYYENWWYKADTGPHTTCQGPVSGTTVTLTGLTSGTPYTYSAYDASGCASANLLDTAPAFTPEASSLTASNIGETTARLTIGGYNGQWWYDADTGPHTTCQGPVTANTSTKDLTGLSANTTYTYEAYSASGCADTDKLATATAFTTSPGLPRNVSVSNSSFNGSTRSYPVSWDKPANTQATDTFAYQVQCTTVNDKTTTSWGACGTQNVSSTANTDLSLTVSHGWSSANFTYVRVRAVKDGRYSAWVIGKTQYGS